MEFLWPPRLYWEIEVLNWLHRPVKRNCFVFLSALRSVSFATWLHKQVVFYVTLIKSHPKSFLNSSSLWVTIRPLNGCRRRDQPAQSWWPVQACNCVCGLRLPHISWVISPYENSHQQTLTWQLQLHGRWFCCVLMHLKGSRINWLSLS